MLYFGRLTKYDPQRWLHLTQWSNSNLLFTKLLGMVLAFVSCIALLVGYRPHGYPDGFNSTSEPVVFGNSLVGTDLDEVFPMWAILAMSLLIFVQVSARDARVTHV